jgi:hypothetical protein
VGYLTRDAILAAADMEAEEVHVPQWGGTVRVRALTGEERDAFEEGQLQGKGKNRTVRLANIRAKLVSLCVVDADGKRLFSDADVAALGRKSAAALSAVFDVAARLSGLTEQDVEELAGNFSSTPGDDSSST